MLNCCHMSKKLPFGKLIELVLTVQASVMEKCEPNSLRCNVNPRTVQVSEVEETVQVSVMEKRENAFPRQNLLYNLKETFLGDTAPSSLSSKLLAFFIGRRHSPEARVVQVLIRSSCNKKEIIGREKNRFFVSSVYAVLERRHEKL
ncbi:hypothetical protein BpHYR1_000349 [Brachionus plicatilis]|uniref:Uncharacterized protein n=1 Tax=Brachionus plicatilis TaxID=10195 RepID=A0A3M7SC08_BRAPC|nr:hypothetical protein BpHYR1_000349 [Brachionus plicatilis]